MQFSKEKNDRLRKTDLSKKGSIDSRITKLVDFINDQNCYITTSSCSGRTIIFTNSETKKKDCSWLFVSHDEVLFDVAMNSLNSHSGSAVLKFEPFVLHTQCSTIEDAQKLLQCGIQSGFKNSGISIGKSGKIIVAIRSTLSLEIPLSSNGTVLVSNEYIEFILKICNEKMQDNWQRIERFYVNLHNLINSHQEHLKPMKAVKTEFNKLSIRDCDEKPLMSDAPVDTYYDGFHSLVNDSGD